MGSKPGRRPVHPNRKVDSADRLSEKASTLRLAFPRGRARLFGWSFGRCSCPKCATARVRLRCNVPSRRRPSTRRRHRRAGCLMEPSFHKFVVGPFQIPGQDAVPSRRLGAVLICNERSGLGPRRAPDMQSGRTQVVQVEVMSLGLEAVRVLAGVGTGGELHQGCGVDRPRCPHVMGQIGPRFGMQMPVGNKPPSRQHQPDNGKGPPQWTANGIMQWPFQQLHGSSEPRNRF